jgi:hypothetical protein
MVLAGAAVVVVRAAGGAALTPAPGTSLDWLPYNTPRSLEARRTFEEDAASAGRALIFVRYGPAEPLRRDWVYNRPDPPRSPVVWVNDLGPEQNARTARAYTGRRRYCVTIEGGRAQPADCDRWVAPDRPLE